MRLINADALFQTMENAEWYNNADRDEIAEKLVMKAPTIEERKTGRWIPHPEIGWGETWLCSECGEKTTSTVMGKPRYKWCPMCGCKMEVEHE